MPKMRGGGRGQGEYSTGIMVRVHQTLQQQQQQQQQQQRHSLSDIDFGHMMRSLTESLTD